MVFSLPFSIQVLTGKREAGNCKPKQSCKSLPGFSLETVYIFLSYTCISCKQEIYFYKVFQGCFCFSWDMNLSILIGYLSVCTFKVNIYTDANCLKKKIMFSLAVMLGQMTQALLFSHEAR